jgi:putative membrane protein
MILLLHAGEAIQPHDLWEAWTFEPGIAISLLAAINLYLIGASRMGRGIRPRHVATFLAGWLSLAIALMSPLHALGGALFSAHMVQHEILMLVSAPLLVLGRPLVALLWAFPISIRQAAGRLTKFRAIERPWHLATTPSFAWVFHAAALWIWHIPSLFQATLTGEPIHDLQHLSFFLSALLFWWVLFREERRLSYGAGVFYLFTTGLHSGVLGALLTFARIEWYPAYSETAKPWGLTGLEDQQLAGLIMWVPAGLVYMAAALALFAAWLKRSDWNLQMRRSSGLMVILTCIFLTSCADRDVARAASEMTGGDPGRGRTLIRQTGCSSCHTIPGIPGADGLVGPPLNRIGARVYIGGTLPNTAENMIQWLKDPRHVDEHTAMPPTIQDDAQARDIAAYLYTLR